MEDVILTFTHTTSLTPAQASTISRTTSQSGTDTVRIFYHNSSKDCQCRVVCIGLQLTHHESRYQPQGHHLSMVRLRSRCTCASDRVSHQMEKRSVRQSHITTWIERITAYVVWRSSHCYLKHQPVQRHVVSICQVEEACR